MEKVQITGVPETMIQTLYARAKESQKEKPIISDPQAAAIVNQLDYDFDAADKDFSYGSKSSTEEKLRTDLQNLWPIPERESGIFC